MRKIVIVPTRGLVEFHSWNVCKEPNFMGKRLYGLNVGLKMERTGTEHGLVNFDLKFGPVGRGR